MEFNTWEFIPYLLRQRVISLINTGNLFSKEIKRWIWNLYSKNTSASRK